MVVPQWIVISRLIELYNHGWLKMLPEDFLYVYLNVADQIFCSQKEVHTYDFHGRLQTFDEQPAIIYKNGFAEWFDKQSLVSSGKIT